MAGHRLEAAAAEPPSDRAAVVLTATLDNEAISPGTARYLERAISEAERRNAQCIVIMLDTPGGLLTSTRLLTKRILSSPTPVVVYVAPSGSRAASAGVFITLAAHVAAMAPGTSIGAAYPVQLGGLPVGPKSDEPSNSDDSQSKNGKDTTPKSKSMVRQKIVNDTVAWARTLAQLRGRNVDWAADAVEKGVSITATQALDEGVVELIAEDLDQLLAKLQGHQVTTTAGTMTLNTKNAEVQPVSMWWGERILTLIAEPNVAFLLMIFGFYGILFEFYNPGWGISGTLGIICIFLAMFGLAVLPVNYLGLALIFIAMGLIVAEVFVTSYGALSVAGAACLVIGGIMLVDSPSGFARVSLSVVLPISIATVIITLMLVAGIVHAHRKPVQTGGEEMIGKTGRAVVDFTKQNGEYRGMIAIHGERWRAISKTELKAGSSCKITDRTGLTLTVDPTEPDI